MIRFGTLLVFGLFPSLLWAQQDGIQDQSQVDVVVATRSLPKGHQIKNEDLKVETWPRSLAPKTVCNSQSTIIGKRLKVKMSKFSPILQDHLESSSSKPIPSGMKVVAIKIHRPNSILQLLAPGDEVDVIAAYPPRAAGDFPFSLPVLKDVDVYSFEPKENSETNVVGLLVTPQQAEKLVLEQANKSSLKLVLKNSSGSELPSAVETMDEAKKQRIRIVARQLDELASDLEDLDRYESADETRILARKLRVTVRSN